MRALPATILALLLATGCGPPVSKEDLGTIDKKPPQVPGTEEPYKIKQLEKPTKPPPDDPATKAQQLPC
ncbi:MAG: hypothetical protein A2V70_16965 [Planctomycetes bacterium RBG_13_63_9]|nr:MAG: hypothetical protein A2V70_16965 [Planctomycetes bacterium RBG_13_63_9]